MLTSMQASSDNTKALDDFTTLASAIVGASSPIAKGATKTAPGGGAGGAGPGAVDLGLPPGLYEFHYDAYGHLDGLCAVSLFSNNKFSFSHPNNGPITNTGFCPSLEAISAMPFVYVGKGKAPPLPPPVVSKG
jgi:hypothetical protein